MPCMPILTPVWMHRDTRTGNVVPVGYGVTDLACRDGVAKASAMVVIIRAYRHSPWGRGV